MDRAKWIALGALVLVGCSGAYDADTDGEGPDAARGNASDVVADDGHGGDGALTDAVARDGGTGMAPDVAPAADAAVGSADAAGGALDSGASGRDGSAGGTDSGGSGRDAGLGGRDAGASGATFTQVYGVVTAHCSPCHTVQAMGRLTMPNQAAAYRALVGVAASVTECRGMGLNLVTAGNTSSSLFYLTTLGTTCVARMPEGGSSLSPADIATIQSWIRAGALND